MGVYAEHVAALEALRLFDMGSVTEDLARKIDLARNIVGVPRGDQPTPAQMHDLDLLLGGVLLPSASVGMQVARDLPIWSFPLPAPENLSQRPPGSCSLTLTHTHSLSHTHTFVQFVLIHTHLFNFSESHHTRSRSTCIVAAWHALGLFGLENPRSPSHYTHEHLQATSIGMSCAPRTTQRAPGWMTPQTGLKLLSTRSRCLNEDGCWLPSPPRSDNKCCQGRCAFLGGGGAQNRHTDLQK